jgi:uncharacterized protein (DUF302 family)
VDQATQDLQDAVKRNGFGVLHIYDLKQTLKDKGAPIDNECRILDVCNPQKAQEVLTMDMNLNMALPCRISVYEQDGQTKIGLISPTSMLSLLSDSPGLADVANEVEDTIKQMIEEAK